MSEILKQIVILGKVERNVGERLPKIIEVAVDNQSEAKKMAAALAAEIIEILTNFAAGQDFSEFPKSPLSAEEYVLPPELEESHQRALEFLTTKKKLEGMPHVGMLLRGVPGTGKTEYARFLSNKAGVRVFQLDKGAITSAQNPARALRSAFEGLDKMGREKEERYIFLLDEFEQLVRKFIAQKNVSKSTHSSDSTGKGRMKSSSSTLEDHQVQIDEKGEAILAEMKELLSGTGTTENLFVIATSNISGFDSALIRAGRLEEIVVEPIRIPQEQVLYNPETKFEFAPTFIRRILSVFSSAYFRVSEGKTSTALKNVISSFNEAVKDLPSEINAIRSRSEKKISYGMGLSATDPSDSYEKRTDEIRDLVLEKLKGFLGVESGHRYDKGNEIVYTAGELAEIVKKAPESFESEDAIKKIVAGILFR